MQSSPGFVVFALALIVVGALVACFGGMAGGILLAQGLGANEFGVFLGAAIPAIAFTGGAFARKTSFVVVGFVALLLWAARAFKSRTETGREEATIYAWSWAVFVVTSFLISATLGSGVALFSPAPLGLSAALYGVLTLSTSAIYVVGNLLSATVASPDEAPAAG